MHCGNVYHMHYCIKDINIIFICLIGYQFKAAIKLWGMCAQPLKYIFHRLNLDRHPQLKDYNIQSCKACDGNIERNIELNRPDRPSKGF